MKLQYINQYFNKCNILINVAENNDREFPGKVFFL